MGNIIRIHEYLSRRNDYMCKIEPKRMGEIEEVTSGLLKDISFDNSPSIDIVALVKRTISK